jgi:hypothetical protein
VLDGLGDYVAGAFVIVAIIAFAAGAAVVSLLWWIL